MENWDAIDIDLERQLRERGDFDPMPMRAIQHKYNKIKNATFTIYTGPGIGNETIATTNKIYTYPEATLYDKKIAEVTKEIIAKNEDCLILTQSEIVINQFLIKLKNKELNVKNVKIRYIDENGETIDLDVKQRGRIRKAPPGFFEQYGDDLDALI